jgi:hypothetical protein
MKKLTCRKVGIALAVLFIAGIAVSTIYSRSYAERQKPYVHITAAESRAIFWLWDTIGTVEAAAPFFEELGFEWTVIVVVPKDAYYDYTEEFMMVRGWPVDILVDGLGYRIEGRVAARVDHDGDVELTIGFNRLAASPHPGDSATVFLEIAFDEILSAHLVPESAVHYDIFTNEYFIYFVNRRDGMWGREFVAIRQNVHFSRPSRVENLMNIFGFGADFGLPVITWSDQSLYDGVVVRLFD